MSGDPGFSYVKRKPLGVLVERFQNSNYMGRSKRPHSMDGKSNMQLSGFMELVV